MEGCGEGLVVACSGDPPMLELELLVERLPSEGNLHENICAVQMAMNIPR